MKLNNRVYLAGSGGFGLSHPGDCHVYCIDTGKGYILIDTGCGESTNLILDNMQADGIELTRIEKVCITHSHRDHAGGTANIVTALRDNWNAPALVYTSEEEGRLLEKGTSGELGLDLLGFPPNSREEVFPSWKPDTILSHGTTFSMGDVTCRVIAVPGHNPECLCYLFDTGKYRMLFPGDVLTVGGYITIGNWPGSRSDLYRKYIVRLAGYNIQGLFPGHRMWTLRGGQSHIEKAVQAFSGLFPPPNASSMDW